MDVEDQSKREELDVPNCPHCGHDKRTEKELKSGVCGQCKKEGNLGDSKDKERPEMGASFHNRRFYERSKLPRGEVIESVSQVDKNGKVKPVNKKTGRPPIDRDKALRYLCEAFRLDVSDEKACYYAGVGTTWYYEKMKKDTEFSEEIHRAKSYTMLVAHGSVTGAIEAGDSIGALKYLERRDKKRFSPRMEVTGEEGDDIKINVKTEAKKRASKFKNPKSSSKKK